MKIDNTVEGLAAAFFNVLVTEIFLGRRHDWEFLAPYQEKLQLALLEDFGKSGEEHHENHYRAILRRLPPKTPLKKETRKFLRELREGYPDAFK